MATGFHSLDNSAPVLREDLRDRVERFAQLHRGRLLEKMLP